MCSGLGRPAGAILPATRDLRERRSLSLRTKKGNQLVARLASYEGLTGDHLVPLARIAYGRSWQKPLAADRGVSRQAVIRWAKGTYRIPRETKILDVCLRRTRAAHVLAKAMVRRAAAASG
jgi:hypothetical protein